MTSSIVNFLVYSTPTDPTSALVTQSRVFDYRISEDARDAFAAILAKISEDFALYKTSPSTATITEIEGLLGQLNNWSTMKSLNSSGTITQTLSAVDLAVPSGDTTSVKTIDTTMSSGMANAVDKLIRTLRSAGWDIETETSDSTKTAAMDKIAADITLDSSAALGYTSTLYGLDTWITQGLQAAASALITAATGEAVDTSKTSLQELLMIEYVSNGNQILYDQMNSLSTAIDTNQQVLAYLNALQDLMNQKTPEQFVMKLSILQNATLTESTYSNFENSTFNQTLGTTAKFTDANIASYIQSLTVVGDTVQSSSLNTTLKNNLDALLTQNATLITTIKSAIEAPGQNIKDLEVVPEGTDLYIYGIVSQYQNHMTDLESALTDLNSKIANYNNLSSSTDFTTYQSTTSALLTSMSTFYDRLNVLYIGIPEHQWGLLDMINHGRSPTLSEPLLTEYQKIWDAIDGTFGTYLEGYIANVNNYKTSASNVLSLITSFDVNLASVTDAMDNSYEMISGLYNRMNTTIGTTLLNFRNNYNVVDSPYFIDSEGGSLINCFDRCTENLNALRIQIENLEKYRADLITASENKDIPAYIKAFNNFKLSEQYCDEDLWWLFNGSDGKSLNDLRNAIPGWGNYTSPIDSQKLSQKYNSAYNLLMDLYNTIPSLQNGSGQTYTYQNATSTRSALLAQFTIANTNEKIGALCLGLQNLQSAGSAFNPLDSTVGEGYSILLQRIQDNLSRLIDITNSNTGTSGTALASTLKTVLGDFQGANSIQTWVQDFNNNKIGNYQTNLNNAVVASQSLNDAKREELQRTMFIFEEFYKSAMALLTRLTQIIEKMATATAR